MAACWDALDLDRRAKSLDFAKPGEAGALLLAGFRSRPATTSASTSGSFDDAFAKYRGGGEILRRAVAGDVRATGAALVAALEGASEGTALRGHKTTTDLERMVEDDNLEAALALLAEEALLRTYVAERSEAAEAAQRALVAEIDEAAAEEERRDARRAKAKAKKARRRSRRKGEDESGSAAVSTAGEGTEGETRDGDVDRDEDDAAAEAALSRRREDARVDALAAEAAERRSARSVRGGGGGETRARRRARRRVGRQVARGQREIWRGNRGRSRANRFDDGGVFARGGTRRVAVRSTEDGAARSEGGEGGGDGDVVLGDGDVVLARIHAGRASPVDFETPSVDFDPRGESAETPRAVASAGAFAAGLQVSRAAEIDAAGPAPDDGDGDVVLARPAAAPASSRASLDSSTRERRFGR